MPTGVGSISAIMLSAMASNQCADACAAGHLLAILAERVASVICTTVVGTFCVTNGQHAWQATLCASHAADAQLLLEPDQDKGCLFE